MSGEPFELEEALGTLARTPVVLHELLDGLDDRRAHLAPEGQWSAFDVVGHLIDGEETDWIPRGRIILSQAPGRRFEPFDRERHRTRNVGRPLADLLDEFAWLREESLTTLRGWRLTPRELQLTAEHPELGTVTLRQLVGTWVVHDLGHIAQVSRVLAAGWGGEVGPWRAYLPVLEASRRG